MPNHAHGFGWIPDIPDHRDHVYAAPAAMLMALPPQVNLIGNCPPVYDQGQLGSCTANAIGAAIESEQIKQKSKKPFVPSRLFIYYNERSMEGTVNSDSGAFIRDGIKTVNKIGAPPEKDWPYVISKFAVKPSKVAFKDAPLGRALQYARVQQSLNQLKGCLAAGYPFVYGFAVYESFETPQVAQTGLVPMPGPNEQQVGGHAVLCIGYDDQQQRFLVRNSWGVGWGMQGNFTVPYPYLTDPNLSDDFWTIRLVPSASALKPMI